MPGPEDVAVDAPGAGEVQVIPWPLLLRRKVTDKVEASPRYPWIVLATALFGLFSVGFTITILSNSIPRIARDLHSSESTLTWVVTAPLLAFAVFGPAAGKLADLRGQRRVYLYSLGGVSVFAALTAIAPNAAALIACRAIGAAIGAAEGPASLAIINRTFSSEKRSQALGWWSMVGAGAPVIGVVAGGPVVQAFGWRWIFVAQVPLTLATVFLASAVLPDVEGDPHSKFDLPGAATLGVAALSLLLAINRGPTAGWLDPTVAGGVVLAVVLSFVFYEIERRSDHPLLPLAYLRRRNFTFPIATQFFTNFAYMGGFIVTPLFLQNEFHYDETHTGLLLIARPLTFAIAGPLAGYLTLWIGERVSAVGGALAVTASMVALAHVSPGSADIAVIFGLALSGVGMGMSSPAMVASVANSVDPADLGVAGATQQMVNQIGVVLGIQVLQAVQVARAGAVGGVGAFHDAYLFGAVAAAFGVIAALFVRRTTNYSMRALVPATS
ncbi:MAG TPA: MFS transporter [Acidimicrobiales bacterium]|nr:MFS transporter [Acidimicrobiales bacterium]